MAPWRPDMQFAIQHLSTQVLNPTTESRPAVKQLIRYLKGTPQNRSSSRTTHLQENLTATLQFVSKWIQIRHVILQRRGLKGLKHIEIRCLAMQERSKDTRLSVGRASTKDNSADLFAKFLDGPRTQSLARKLELHVTGGQRTIESL